MYQPFESYEFRKYYIQFQEYFDAEKKVHSDHYEKVESILGLSIKSGLIKLTEFYADSAFTIEIKFISPITQSRKEMLLKLVYDKTFGNAYFLPETELDENDRITVSLSETIISKYKDDFLPKEEKERLFI